MLHEIKNNIITAIINDLGAELISLKFNNITTISELYNISRKPGWEKELVGIGDKSATILKSTVDSYCNSINEREGLRWGTTQF